MKFSFEEGLCLFSLWKLQNHTNIHLDKEKELIGDIFIEIYSFLKTILNGYTNPFKNIFIRNISNTFNK